MDNETIRWLLGVAVTLNLTLFGWVFKRQNDNMKDSAESRSKMWAALNRLNEKHHELERRMLESMATKQDLREAEQRITSTITSLFKQLENRQ
ncbi:hypothetical protein [Thalassospira marina]|uniref:Uncharacterized protein n=1 Tax=Thalassospira marina TaxID=2048283 RepID=A0A2N3KXT6_9PROT|nr:hypothetical protein [Thalassospira marina]PKR55395.1 hypothetical protein COO20_04290 [Thalassospira marina]